MQIHQGEPAAHDDARPEIDPHLGLDLRPETTVQRLDLSVSVVIPAHNEEPTIAAVVTEAFASLDRLGVEGEVIVAASGCTDKTAENARLAGARVVDAPIGKGAALKAGVDLADGGVVCAVDGDVRYYGDPPLVELLVGPILEGLADATITDLYWRPLYPQLWMCGFFAPLAGRLYPELLPKVGNTPWSGQRAALRHLWPAELPDDFTVDLALLLHWNRAAQRLRPVLAGDWVNPQRPKPDLMRTELDLLISSAVGDGRFDPNARAALEAWFDQTHRLMARYAPGVDDPQEFEARILERALTSLPDHLGTGA
ncbi:glycosyltransferase [Promicromonospora sp. Populi]|uniref:glycosyltransferase n=1 Tax=Promicromonospora sp. Populi TaxID=3239420 RepID=UPI0034E1F965